MSLTPATSRGNENTASNIKLSLESFQNWLQKKRKRTSPYPTPTPSPPLRPVASKAARKSRHPAKKSKEGEVHVVTGFRSSEESQRSSTRFLTLAEDSPIVRQLRDMRQGIVNPPTGQIQGLGQPECDFRCISARRASLSGRRRSSAASARPREILSPQDFTPGDFRKPLKWSQPRLPNHVFRVSQPHPVWPGWRVMTKAQSPESCFITTVPFYSARSHSPLDTGRPFTRYFEGAIRPGNEDEVCLALGFVAGKDRVSRMPGFEYGSIGICCRGRRLYLNNFPVENTGTAAFEPGQQLGIGITFSKRDCDTQQVDNAQARLPSASSPSIDVEVFLSRDGKKAGCWNLGDLLAKSDSLPLDGLEGNHDLYAAVGTKGAVDVDILFEPEDWRAKDWIY